MIRGESGPPTSHVPTATDPDDDVPSVDDVANAVAVVFTSFEPTRDDLVTTALRNRAHPRIIAALRALPSRRYHNLQQVRVDLHRQRQRGIGT